MVRFILLLSILVLGTIICEESQPGFVIMMTEEGLATVQRHFLPDALKKRVTNLPNITQHKRLDFIGTVKLNMTDLKMRFLDPAPETIDVKFVNETHYDLTITKMKAKVDFNYKFVSGFYNQVSNGFINITNMTVKLTNVLKTLKNEKIKDKNGPGLEISHGNVTNITVNVEFDQKKNGRLEQLTSIIIDKIQNGILQILQSNLQGEKLKELNAKIAKTIVNIPTETMFDKAKKWYIDYSMLETPIIKDNYLRLAFDATIFKEGETKVKPYPVMNPEIIKGRPITGYLNRNVLEKLLDYSPNFKKSHTLKSEDVPEKVPIKLTTEALSETIPELYEAFGSKNYPVDLNATIVLKSLYDLKKGNITLVADLYMNFLVREADDKQVDAMTVLNAGIKLEADVVLNDGVVKAKALKITRGESKQVNPENARVKVKSIDEINDLLDVLLEMSIPMINEQLNKREIKVPTLKGISFEKTSGILRDNYFSFNLVPIVEKKKPESS